MNSENVSTNSTKKIVGEVLLDVITMGLLLAAFGTMFYNGFIIQSEGFTVGIMAAITVIGLIILFFIGTISCLTTKAKKHTLTAGFLTFSAIQLFALVCNWTVLACLLFKLFTVEDSAMRITYLVTTAVIIIGYIVSILSYSGGIVEENAEGEEYELDEDEEESDDDDDEEEDDEEEAEDSEEDSDENLLTDE